MKTNHRGDREHGRGHETREHRSAQKAIEASIRGLNRGTGTLDDFDDIDVGAACAKQKRRDFR